MNRVASLTLILLAGAAPIPAFAQQQSAAASATAAQPVDELSDEELEGEEIVVQGQRLVVQKAKPPKKRHRKQHPKAKSVYIVTPPPSPSP